jgi:putative ABC transport system permease protein
MITVDLVADWLADIRLRLRAVFRRAELERELDDELRFHLERETEKNVRAGVERGEATRRARIAFGGVDRVKEDTRDARGVRVLEMVVRDLRYAIRGLRAHPGFTLAVVATLALGIGANTAMFGIVDRLMFRPLAYLHDEASVNRVYVHYDFRGKPEIAHNFEYTRYLDFAAGTKSFSQHAALYTGSFAVGTGDDVRETQVAVVSASYFDFFDAHPVIGRFFNHQEDSLPAGTPVVVLGQTLWKTRYGSRTDVLGQQLQVGAMHATIIGVAPAGFNGPDPAKPVTAFIPITAYAYPIDSTYYIYYHWGWTEMMVRRKPGISTAAATADLTNAYTNSWARERSLDPNLPAALLARPRVILAPMQLSRGPDAGQDAKVVLWICGVAAIVLLIACANVANLLLGRALRRRREIAVRLALGVTRRRLMAQLLVESVLLALLGGVAGILLGQAGSGLLRTLFVPQGDAIGLSADRRTLLFAACVAILAGVLTGLAPALHSAGEDLVTALKTGVREGTHQRSRTRSALLLAQGALSVFLLVGAALFVRSLNNVASLRLGYDVDPVLHVERVLRGTKLSDDEKRVLGDKLFDAATAIPGVEHASLTLSVPFWDTESNDFFVPGIDSVQRLGQFTVHVASHDYFATMGTRILRGRGFDATDRAGAPLVAVVSEGAASALWPGRNPIGKCMKIKADTMPCTTVVGVAENIKQESLTDEGERLQYYLPFEQLAPSRGSLLLRSRGDARPLAETVRKRLQPLMPGTSYITVTPMRDIVDPALASWRMGATMFTLFGALALTLAAIGLYSVIAYDVAHRTHELGLRVALGAHAGDVLWLVVTEGIRYALAGIAIGAAIALAAAHWLQPLLFGETARDPLVLAAVAAILVVVAATASAIPAWRAAHVDPSIALRTE